MGLVQRRLETRIRPHLAEAMQTVQRYYFTKPQRQPPVSVGLAPTRWEKQRMKELEEEQLRREYGKDAEIGELPFYKRWLYNAAYYLWCAKSELIVSGRCHHITGRISVSYLCALTTTRSRIREVLAHEATHYAMRESAVSPRDIQFLDPNEQRILSCASEGLAVATQKHYLMYNLPSRTEKILEIIRSIAQKVVMGIVAPIKFTSLAMDYAILSKLSPERQEKLGELVDNHPFISRFIWPYGAGYRFVKQVVQGVGNVPQAFELLCKNPPKSFAEIFDPQRYIERTRDAVSELELVYV